MKGLSSVGHIVRFSDSGSRCFAVVQAGPDPIWISVAQSGVLVKRSRMGILGLALYKSRDLVELSRLCEVLDAQPLDVDLPVDLTNPVLALFTALALHSNSASEVAGYIRAALGES